MKLKYALVAIVSSVAASSVFAGISLNAGVVSSYIFRGLHQSDFELALQGGLDYSHDSGFYVRDWSSSIEWLKDFGISKSKIETDFYGSFKANVGDFGYDIGFLRYEYWSKYGNATSPNTNEVYGTDSWNWFTLKYSYTLTNAFANPDSQYSSYIDLTAIIPTSDKISLTLHRGYQKIKGPLDSDTSDSDSKMRRYDFGGSFTVSGDATFTKADKTFYTPSGKKFIGKTTPYIFAGYSKLF